MCMGRNRLNLDDEFHRDFSLAATVFALPVYYCSGGKFVVLLELISAETTI